MSRVEDDRDAARAAARLAEAKRTEEALKTKKATDANTFSKLVQGQKKDAQAAKEQNLAKSAIAQLLEAAEAGHLDEARHAGEAEHGAGGTAQQQSFKSKLGDEAHGQALQQRGRAEGQHVDEAKGHGHEEAAHATSGQETDRAGAGRLFQGRTADAKASREKLETRREDSQSSKSSSAPAGSASKGDKADLKADSDKGGGQQQGNKDGKDGGAGSPSIRFNPALMAPVPVAKAREASGSDRLRKVANEVAQKIVDRVRVGTNAAGKAEFQIDLRSDVLSGLSVKVSARNGKISAVFQGTDKDVLKMIEEHGDALRAALGARGLSLEDFKIEGRG